MMDTTDHLEDKSYVVVHGMFSVRREGTNSENGSRAKSVQYCQRNLFLKIVCHVLVTHYPDSSVTNVQLEFPKKYKRSSSVAPYMQTPLATRGWRAAGSGLIVTAKRGCCVAFFYELHCDAILKLLLMPQVV
jgi:hypothetical protein